MNIAICEDILAQREQLIEIIFAWVHKRQRPSTSSDKSGSANSTAQLSAALFPTPTIHQYADINSFFFNLEEHGPFDLLFLDIDLSGESARTASATVAGTAPTNEDGLRIAARIREQDSNAVIVFVTEKTHYVFEGYKVQAYDFLPKPIFEKDIERVLDYTSEKLSKTAKQAFLVDTNRGIKRVMLTDIYYFKAQRQFVELYGVQGTETFRARLADIIAELTPHGFISPHRSYLVNMSHMVSLSKGTLVTTKNRVIPIAKNRQKEVAKAWLDYYREYP